MSGWRLSGEGDNPGDDARVVCVVLRELQIRDNIQERREPHDGEQQFGCH